jgi:hypothetical protein
VSSDVFSNALNVHSNRANANTWRYWLGAVTGMCVWHVSRCRIDEPRFLARIGPERAEHRTCGVTRRTNPAPGRSVSRAKQGFGEVAERPKALDWNSSNIFTGVRGFESHPLRQMNKARAMLWAFFICREGGIRTREPWVRQNRMERFWTAMSWRKRAPAKDGQGAYPTLSANEAKKVQQCWAFFVSSADGRD